jgi:hypothetical protein
VLSLRQEIAALGFQITARPSDIPRPSSASHPDKHGDLFIRTAGLCQGSSRSCLSNQAWVVLDVSLVHSFSTGGPLGGIFNKSKLSQSEKSKEQTYKQDYERVAIAFAPIIGDTIGQIGPTAIRLFKRLADVTSHGSAPPTAQSVLYSNLLYHRLRLRFLYSLFEATAERLLRAPPQIAEAQYAHSIRSIPFVIPTESEQSAALFVGESVVPSDIGSSSSPVRASYSSVVSCTPSNLLPVPSQPSLHEHIGLDLGLSLSPSEST